MSYTPNVIPYTVRELIEKLKEYPEWYFVENVFKVDCTSNQTVKLFDTDEIYQQGYDHGYDSGARDGYEEGFEQANTSKEWLRHD